MTGYTEKAGFLPETYGLIRAIRRSISEMPPDTSIRLKRLKKILKKDDEKYLFPCITDLVANGLTLARFTDEDHTPSRQDITQFIAAWFKYIGLTSDECRDWMIKYCVEVLSIISSSSKSKIRHSTKSNIKYIYKSDVTLDCGCENNRFKASCEKTCPVYEEMSNKHGERLAKEANRSYELQPIKRYTQVFVPHVPVKEKYRDQFEKAWEVVLDNINKGVAIKNIVTVLNERGLKTRTGREWTFSILQAELKKHDVNIEKLKSNPAK